MRLNKMVFANVLLVISTSSINAYASSDVILQGVITNSACDITVNGGKPLLDVGVFKSSLFVANQPTAQVDLPVALNNCAVAEEGRLVVQGLTSTGNSQQNVFVGNEADTVGFMISQSDGTTLLSNGQGVPIALGSTATSANYIFKVGMASTTAAPLAGTYSAPILVAYVVE